GRRGAPRRERRHHPPRPRRADALALRLPRPPVRTPPEAGGRRADAAGPPAAAVRTLARRRALHLRPEQPADADALRDRLAVRRAPRRRARAREGESRPVLLRGDDRALRRAADADEPRARLAGDGVPRRADEHPG